MGSHEAVFKSFEQVATRGDPYWWLSAVQCRGCAQAWLVGSEERQNDIFCLRRLTPDALADIVQGNSWPHDFERYETLLELGRRAGRSVRFTDPLTSPSLRATVTDLARGRPGIALSTLVELLNLDRELAEQVATSVIKQTGVAIDLDR
jgi:hypothetical protein